MIKKRKVLAVIPARGGSKRIKNKNFIDICGKPLIQYTIEAALKCEYIDKTIVSTDSEKIAYLSEMCGAEVPFIRPIELSNDYAKSIDVLMHAINFFENQGEIFDIIILLQPTSPLRNENDIKCALEFFEEKNENSLVSVSEVDISPILLRERNQDGFLYNLLQGESTIRKQDMKQYYEVNGAIYINAVSELSQETSLNDNKVGWILEKERSIDIDEMDDVVRVKRFLAKNI